MAEPGDAEPRLSRHESAARIDAVEPLWKALNDHHGRINPELGPGLPARDSDASWERRRAKYATWLAGEDSFYVLAEDEGRPVGYAMVTIGPGYASWETSERLAELETLSVLAEARGRGIGVALLDAVAERLAELGVEDLTLTTAVTNVDAHRFYERHGFAKRFVVYHRRARR